MLLHQPHGGVEGQSADIARQRHRVEEILGEHTGQTIERIHEDTERDFILGPQEALAYELVDELVTRRALVGAPQAVALRP